MRPILFTAIAAGTLIAGAAVAQTPPPPGNPPPPPPREAGPTPPGPMGGPMDHGPMEHGPMEHGSWMRMMHGRMPPPPKAAFFRFRKGDSSVTVKCADDEPTKACTDAVSAMMQAINAGPK